jgi:hypothetical protein
MGKLRVKDIESCKSFICPQCYDILIKYNGLIPIEGENVQSVEPKLWKHSEKDLYHAWVKVHNRHVILCGSHEFDEMTLKRIRPIKKEENEIWNISIRGNIYQIYELGEDGYEILDEEGMIVKDEEIEARVFTYMIGIKTENTPLDF